MTDRHKLIMTKIAHTVIWFFMALATIYIFYAGITRTFSFLLWVSIIMLSIESIILILNGWTCPLTHLAKKYTNKDSDNFDIYLPKTIAKYNKIVFGTIFVIGLFLVIYNILNA